jgi:HEAT repeat protein
MEKYDPKKSTGAFEYLNEYFFLSAEESSPDEAFDWIFMMHEEDWHLLTEAWQNRPPEWRESCAYILGEGLVEESLPLLRQALFDENFDVATQAACAIASQRLNLDEEAPAIPTLDDEIISQLRKLVTLADGKYMEEVIELLQIQVEE